MSNTDKSINNSNRVCQILKIEKIFIKHFKEFFILLNGIIWQFNFHSRSN